MLDIDELCLLSKSLSRLNCWFHGKRFEVNSVFRFYDPHYICCYTETN
jgi:hypothetical protein